MAIIEEWKPILVGKLCREGNHEVSNLGRIRNRKTLHILKTYKIKNRNGEFYERIDLQEDGTEYKLLVHRIVAIAFHPNPEQKSTVNHKDENTLNNTADNLEWATQREQELHKSFMAS